MYTFAFYTRRRLFFLASFTVYIQMSRLLLSDANAVVDSGNEDAKKKK